MTTNDKSNEREEEERGTIGGVMMVKESSPIPRKLNHGMITALSECIAKGNYVQTACQLCGINHSTFYLWTKLGEQHSENNIVSEYTRLLDAVKKAEAQAEARLVEVVREAAEVKREWLPAMTMLERRHPDRWGRKDRTQVDITERKTIQITHEVVVKDYGQGHAIDVPHTPGLPQPGDDESVRDNST